MKYYAIADLHGRFDLLLKAEDQISQHAGGQPYKVITLGDYIDRGPDSNKIIQYLMDMQEADPSGNICLQGNHEAMMVESIKAPLMPGWWIGNGGDTTLQSYGWGGYPFNICSYEVVPKTHLDWMESLPLYYETEKQIFVHAGIPQQEMSLPPKTRQSADMMQWMLYDKREAGGWKGKHVVHGHHQFDGGPHVWKSAKGGRTDLDTYAWKTGRIVVGVFDDTQLEAVDFIEVTDGSS